MEPFTYRKAEGCSPGVTHCYKELFFGGGMAASWMRTWGAETGWCRGGSMWVAI